MGIQLFEPKKELFLQIYVGLTHSDVGEITIYRSSQHFWI